jgi:DNA primase
VYRKIPENILEAIRERTSIEQVIGEYVPLKRAGRHFKGLCPFHQEKTASFTVNTDLQIFKCFGCGESGNIFNFLMKYENINFREAVEKMALASGITLPETESESPETKTERRHLLDILNQAWNLYRKTLLESPLAADARNYLSKRGLTKNHILKYGLGYAPDQWDYLIRSLNHSGRYLISSGLVLKHKESGKMYDRFRNRIMFPIRHYNKGDILGFGGRTLGNDPAKYINSPETVVYHKGSTLYGLYEAGKVIRDSRTVFLVEGYFDRIAMDIAGIPNSVAPCGTALSAVQIKLIKRYADSLTILFDSDAAGIKAAQRALELSLAQGIECYAVPLPEGRDPDDILSDEGSEKLKCYLNKPLPGIDYLIRTASNRHNLNHSRGRRHVVEELAPFLIDVKNAIDRGSYIARIADLISVPPASVLELCRRRISQAYYNSDNRRSNGSAQNETSGPHQMERICFREKELFVFLVLHQDYVAWKDNPLTPDNMITQTGRLVYSAIKQDVTENGSLALDRILSNVDNPQIQKILIDLFYDPDMKQRLIQDDPHITFLSIAENFKENELRKEMEYIKKQILKPDITSERVELLLKRKLELLDKINGDSPLDAKEEQ